jgi:F-type H+-transporting ATPase subunit delta
MTSSAVANRYANALADVALDPKSQTRTDVILAELRSFTALLVSSGEMQNALASPAVSLGQKRAVIARIADAQKIGPVTRNFLLVLSKHRRMDALPAIVDAFETVLDARLGFSRGDVISAQELTGEQRTQLEMELSRLTGKGVRLRYRTDPGLIGGVVAHIGSTVYDGSVKGRLEKIERQLSAQ